jgi:hypothetical protein
MVFNDQKRRIAYKFLFSSISLNKKFDIHHIRIGCLLGCKEENCKFALQAPMLLQQWFLATRLGMGDFVESSINHTKDVEPREF